jgi:hypothetical protein
VDDTYGCCCVGSGGVPDNEGSGAVEESGFFYKPGTPRGHLRCRRPRHHALAVDDSAAASRAHWAQSGVRSSAPVSLRSRPKDQTSLIAPLRIVFENTSHNTRVELMDP